MVRPHVKKKEVLWFILSKKGFYPTLIPHNLLNSNA